MTTGIAHYLLPDLQACNKSNPQQAKPPTATFYQGMRRPSSQLMNCPVVDMSLLMTSNRTRLAPSLASTAPSMSQISLYFAVISVRLKPGWSMITEMPFERSSSAKRAPTMLLFQGERKNDGGSFKKSKLREESIVGSWPKKCLCVYSM